jgi:hypothetical protein
MTNHLYVRGSFDRLTLVIYGWKPSESLRRDVLENEFETNINDLQIHVSYNNIDTTQNQNAIETHTPNIDITKD